MFAQKVRGAVIVMTLVALPASQADACEFLRRCFGGGATYAPAPVMTQYAPVCCPQPCCPQPQVSYMPQTCYRTVYQNVPVVAYRPTTACDPCTGCPRTVMQPVTSYVARPQLVPYTAYRPVVTAGYAQPCATGCAPAATMAAYPSVQAYASYAAPSTTGSCCTPGTTSAYAPAPAATMYAPAGAVGSTVTSLAPAPAYPAPSTPINSSPAAPQTFEQPSTPAAEPESRMMQPLQLNPSTSNSNSLGEPRALDPETEDRMTEWQTAPTLTARLVSTESKAIEYGNDGWRASSK